jgi:hypothetical protein
LHVDVASIGHILSTGLGEMPENEDTLHGCTDV